MPVIDVNGNEITHHEIFPDDNDVRNIEIGAGRTAFGKKFFPNCYLTEKEGSVIETLTHFSELSEYKEGDSCHFIDHFKDAEELTEVENRFNRIICCNPYEYGFGNPTSTVKTLNIFGDLLVDNGEITILGCSANKWSSFNRFERYYRMYGADITHNFNVVSFEKLDQTHRYLIDQNFYLSDMNVKLTPTFAYTLSKAS